MKIKVKDLRDICDKISNVMNQNSAELTQVIEITCKNKKLTMATTDKSFYAIFNKDIDSDEEFKAIIKAEQFLKLVKLMTVEEVTLTKDDKCVTMVGNGEYKLPLFDLDILPIIDMQKNKTFDIDKSILQDIVNYTLKEFSRGVVNREVGSKVYLDEKNCIACTTGAVIINHTLPESFKVLIPAPVVKGFNLFEEDKVHFSIDENNLGKIELSDKSFTLTFICSNDLINKFPTGPILDTGKKPYDIEVKVSKNELLNVLQRIQIFNTEVDTPCKCLVDNNGIKLYGDNFNELIPFINTSKMSSNPYNCYIIPKSLISVIDTVKDDNIDLKLGDNFSFVIPYNNVITILPEADVIEE